MAKQKRKKPVHKNKPVLPRKDRTVYEIILLFVFSVSLILLRSHEYVFYYCASLFGTRDGYYYDDGGMSSRRGRDRMGRFTSRDASEMSRKLREMMEEAPDENTKREIQRLADRMEQM